MPLPEGATAQPWGPRPCRRRASWGVTVLWCCGASAAAALAQAPARAEPPAPQVARVLHITELPRRAVQGLRPLELSALAWDPVQQQLWAASDRGTLFRWQVDPARPEVLQPLQARQVQPPEAQRQTLGAPVPDSQAVNAEALAWRAGAAGEPGSLWLGGEHEPAAWQLDTQGRTVGARPWPAALARQAGARPSQGIEAMAWHPKHGLMAALSGPQRAPAGLQQVAGSGQAREAVPAGGQPAKHWFGVHADQRAWWFAAAARRSQLKAIEVMGEQGLLLLERVPASSGFRPLLRWLHLPDCGGQQVCVPQAVAFEPALPAAPHNHEGLACTPDGLCWMVSDGRGTADAPTQLVVFQLQR